jgi:hypothetical protein
VAVLVAAARFVVTRKPIAEMLERWEPCCFPIVLLIGLGMGLLGVHPGRPTTQRHDFSKVDATHLSHG